MELQTHRSSLFKSQPQPPQESFPFVVSEFDLRTEPHKVIGIRMDTGESVAVFLEKAVAGQSDSKAKAEQIAREGASQLVEARGLALSASYSDDAKTRSSETDEAGRIEVAAYQKLAHVSADVAQAMVEAERDKIVNDGQLSSSIRFDQAKHLAAVTNRESSSSAAPEYRRLEIADLAQPRVYIEDPGVSAGGTMFASSAREVGPGLYSTRWLSTMSHHADEAEIILATAHYHGAGMSRSKQAISARVTFLFDHDNRHLTDVMYETLGNTQPTEYHSLSELQDALIQLLSKNIHAGVRLVKGGRYDAVQIFAQPDTPAESVVADFVRQRLPENFDALLQEGMKVEIIPLATAFLGPRSAEDIYKALESAKTTGKTNRHKVKVDRYLSENDKPGGPQFRTHYGLTALAFRLTDPDQEGRRSAYLTHVEPMFSPSETFAGLRDAICSASTTMFKPKKVYSDIKPGLFPPSNDVPVTEAPASKTSTASALPRKPFSARA